MSDEDHGIDIDEDTDLETADEEPDETVPDDAEPPVDHTGDRYDEKEAEARDRENPDAHRDEEPFQS